MGSNDPNPEQTRSSGDGRTVRQCHTGQEPGCSTAAGHLPASQQPVGASSSASPCLTSLGHVRKLVCTNYLHESWFFSYSKIFSLSPL